MSQIFVLLNAEQKEDMEEVSSLKFLQNSQ